MGKERSFNSMKPILPTSYACIICKPSKFLECPLRRSLSTSQRLGQNLRPPTAPKQFPNIKHIRQNVQTYAENCIERNYKAEAPNAGKIASLAEESNEVNRNLLGPRARLNDLSKQIAKTQTA